MHCASLELFPSYLRLGLDFVEEWHEEFAANWPILCVFFCLFEISSFNLDHQAEANDKHIRNELGTNFDLKAIAQKTTVSYSIV